MSIFTSFASNDLKVTVNGEVVNFDVKPYIDTNGRTMIPVRFISEKLGCKVNWDDISKVVAVNKGDTNIVLKIGESKATVNGEVMIFDTQAVIISGRTMVPLRFVSEALGARVGWDGKTRTVSIVTVDMFYEPLTVEEQERLNQYEDNKDTVIPTDMYGEPRSHYRTNEDLLSNPENSWWKIKAVEAVEAVREFYSLMYNADYRTINKEDYIKKLAVYYGEDLALERYGSIINNQYIVHAHFKTNINNVYIDHGQRFRIRGTIYVYIENDLNKPQDMKFNTWYKRDLEYSFYYNPDEENFKFRNSYILSDMKKAEGELF